MAGEWFRIAADPTVVPPRRVIALRIASRRKSRTGRVECMPEPGTNTPQDVFTRLFADHARTEQELKRLDQASIAAAREERDPAALAQIAATLAYFAGPGERHEAFEEQALFPALRPLPEF